jgi:hypothetical protein
MVTREGIMKNEPIDFARRRRLWAMGRLLREYSINRQGDYEGWQISQLLRDAHTVAQADEAEKRFVVHTGGSSPPT